MWAGSTALLSRAELRLDWLTVTKTTAYYTVVLITGGKCFIVVALGSEFAENLFK
jgi:hypothetical protein